MRNFVTSLLFVPGLMIAGSAYGQVDATGDVKPQTDIRYESKEHFARQNQLAAGKFRFSGSTKNDVNTWRKTFLPELKSRLGLDVIATQTQGYVPRVEKMNSEDAGSFTREHWIIWTEPTVPLPMTVLFPKGKTGKLPLVITPHGHGRNSILYKGIYPYTGEKEEGKTIEQTEGRSVAVQAVKEGYIAIAPTTRAFGITRTEADKRDSNSFSCHNQLMQDLLVGRTPIGDRVWDMMRVLDWAIQNLPIDKNKIAITGNSGGGTVSLFAAACDPRITVAAPSSAFSSFEASIGSVPHCDCNYIPGLLQMGETGDVAGLVAPRALCLITGVYDKDFSISGARVSFQHLQNIYRAAGAAGNVMLYEGDGGHKYYPEGSWPFIRKYFK